MQQKVNPSNNKTNDFDFKERINRFKNVNTRKFELNFGEDKPAKDGTQKFWWTWSRDGRLWSEGLDYTLRIVTILDEATDPVSNWRFYCENKKVNFTSHYYWSKDDPRVQKKVRGGEGGREGGREGGGEGGRGSVRDEGEWPRQLLLPGQKRRIQRRGGGGEGESCGVVVVGTVLE